MSQAHSSNRAPGGRAAAIGQTQPRGAVVLRTRADTNAGRASRGCEAPIFARSESQKLLQRTLLMSPLGRKRRASTGDCCHWHVCDEPNRGRRGRGKGPIRAEKPAVDDVVDVIDTVNIAAPADTCEGRSWTSLTP